MGHAEGEVRVVRRRWERLKGYDQSVGGVEIRCRPAKALGISVVDARTLPGPKRRNRDVHVERLGVALTTRDRRRRWSWGRRGCKANDCPGAGDGEAARTIRIGVGKRGRVGGGDCEQQG